MRCLRRGRDRRGAGRLAGGTHLTGRALLARCRITWWPRSSGVDQGRGRRSRAVVAWSRWRRATIGPLASSPTTSSPRTGASQPSGTLPARCGGARHCRLRVPATTPRPHARRSHLAGCREGGSVTAEATVRSVHVMARSAGTVHEVPPGKRVDAPPCRVARPDRATIPGSHSGRHLAEAPRQTEPTWFGPSAPQFPEVASCGDLPTRATTVPIGNSR